MSTKSICMLLAGVISLLMLSACMKHPTNAGPDGSADNLTVGKVQGEIKIGMPADRPTS